jgi:ribonuclease HI
MAEKLKHVIIYTDGACTGNPGPGGYGVILKYGTHRKELSAGYRKTTNNRMELMAVIAGLQALKDRCQVTLYSDSQYLVESLSQGWAKKWQENGWKRNKKKKAKNPDLWEILLHLFEQHEIDIKWVRGHAGEEENERADFLATNAIKKSKLSVDDYYENLIASKL